ncbi:DUF5107 domain-containing protein [uncultured Chitinophaga sp.]|mgnify:CR=1 FL=1|jgi:hypothetical protein|uniref:DUF5107 domain-containing protein n=1 Tax=uncultured Chitinophaga sp. TaxID=339340 RepID=UPI002609D5A4|nr:DUF5107 domain-containing protein [uncultured Chitinophaga sp.]
MNKRVALLLLLSGSMISPCMSHEKPGKVICSEYEDYLLTDILTPAGPVPAVSDPNGVYPYISYVETSSRPVVKKYQLVVLENELVKATICPDLGGKVLSLVHKPSGKEVLYKPEVIRHTRILPRCYSVAGGIEVSFPVSHAPSQNEQLSYRIDRLPDRTYVTCGERELRFGMQWSVEYSLGPDDPFLTERVKCYNPGKDTYPWMCWTNAALPSAPDTRYNFPNGKVLVHASGTDTIDWGSQGPRTESNIREMTGYCWKTKDVNAFGAYTPSLGVGLYHIADNKVAGIKLWSYGTVEDSIWSALSASRHQPYIELQGGPGGDQPVKQELASKATISHVEYWIPSDKELDIHTLQLPHSDLRPVSTIPLFDWAGRQETDIWRSLRRSFENKTSLPLPPRIDECIWPPSGMEDLDGPFRMAIGTSNGEEHALWQFYYGAWLAGRGRNEDAVRSLTASKTGVAKVLLARLLLQQNDMQGARDAFNAIHEKWLQLHPQVVVERDILLRSVGTQTIPEREAWLNQVAALPDEWLMERRVQLLIDKGALQQAKALLLSTPFQKVNQTSARTALWMQLCGQLKEPCTPVPQQLGDDRLARFGAYREYE